MSKNIRETGDGKIEIDTDRRPVFKLGNGAKKECLSTATVGGRNGSLEVHVHGSPNQPVLLSRKALRALGAVIDFGTNETMFLKVDKKRVIRLREAAHGDVLQGAQSRSSEFKGLLNE